MIVSAITPIRVRGSVHEIRHGAAAEYSLLTGRSSSQALVTDDCDFDRHVFASILAVAAVEAGALTEQVGLPIAELTSLYARWFSHVRPCAEAEDGEGEGEPTDEIELVRELLLANRSTASEDSRWLAFMIARRAVQPNHLWEDLGLRSRDELSRLLFRHFAPLARRNVKNMRWKRFFYRTLCESDGLVMCATPVCSSCGDFDLCFGAEDGESRIAQRRRRLVMAATAH
jgi:nitrogen fixation protein NifQ